MVNSIDTSVFADHHTVNGDNRTIAANVNFAESIKLSSTRTGNIKIANNTIGGINYDKSMVVKRVGNSVCPSNFSVATDTLDNNGSKYVNAGLRNNISDFAFPALADNTIGGINYDKSMVGRRVGNSACPSIFRAFTSITPNSNDWIYDKRINSSSAAPDIDPTSRPLIVVDISGTNPERGSDWFSNFTNVFLPELLSDGYHYGIKKAADEVLDNFNEYISNHNLNNPIVLVNGHSRGAAAANTLAHELSNSLETKNVFAYTFASLNVKEWGLTERQNIFNIMNRNDFVPYYPMSLFRLGPIGEQRCDRYGRNIPITMKYDWLGYDFGCP